MAKKDFPLDIDLMKNELQNSSFHKLSVPPSSPVIGQFYYDTDDKIPYYWNGLLWKDFGGSAGMVESVTSTDNHIVVDNTDSLNPSLSFQLVDNENLLTDDELVIVQNTSGINKGDQVGDGTTITGAGTIADPFVATNTSLWQQKQNELLNQLWLPSIGELQVIHDVLYANGIDVFYGSTKKYWSSCDVDMLTAYYFDMINNTVGVEDKESDLVCGVIRCNKFTSTEILSLGELTNHGGYVFYIVNNGTDFTYWEAFKTDFYGIWHGTGSWFYTGTTSPAFGEGENNTNEILALDEYHFTLAYLVRSIPTTVDNSQIIEPKNEKLIETADIIDIDKYLKKDTTLQTADTPISTSLFSFWKIGVGRVKIAWSDFINLLGQTFQRINSFVEVTLTSSGWTGNSQTITVTGILATDWLTPYPKTKIDQDKWATAELFCSAHTTNSVTFTCVTTPTSDIVILIKIEKR